MDKVILDVETDAASIIDKTGDSNEYESIDKRRKRDIFL